MFWTRPIAATAYIDGAIAGTLTTVSHGLAAAASWALQAVEAAMLWALNAAINWLVQHILKPAFQPIISIATTYTTNLAGDVSAHNASKFWQDFSWWPFWAVVLIGATAITIALGALDVFSLGTTFLALLIIGVVVSGIESLGSSEKAAFAGDGPFSGSIVTELSTLVAPTGGSVLSSSFSSLSGILSTSTTSVAIANVIAAATPPAKPGWTDTWGAALGLMALLMAGVANAIHSVAAAVVSFLLDVDSVIIDAIALGGGAALEDEIVFGMDFAAGFIDYSVVASYANLPCPW